MRKRIFFLLLVTMLILGCSLPVIGQMLATTTPTSTVTSTATPTVTITATPTETYTPTETATPTETTTPTQTVTPSPSPTVNTPIPQDTPTPSPTPTDVPPSVTGLMTGNCRWGPSTEYRIAGVAIHEDEVASVEGRNIGLSGTWYWIQIEGVAYHCWVHASTVTVNGDPAKFPYLGANVPTNPSVAPPTNVSASRNGNNVTVTWSSAAPALELAYLIEAIVCLDGYLFNVPKETTATSYTLRDDSGCSSSSYGTLRVVNKLGYSNAVAIPWP